MTGKNTSFADTYTVLLNKDIASCPKSVNWNQKVFLYITSVIFLILTVSTVCVILCLTKVKYLEEKVDTLQKELCELKDVINDITHGRDYPDLSKVCSFPLALA